MIDAVVFDMDGVLVDTEHVWDEVRAQLTGDWGGLYTEQAQREMMGMSSTEWSRYMHETLGLSQSPGEINAEVVRRMVERYRQDLPVVAGAPEAVRRLSAAGFALAVASSSNRPLIDVVLDAASLTDLFEVTVSSEEVAQGKPSPDVYLEAARRLGVGVGRCAAVEDSTNGIRAARAAGMRVVAYPNRRYRPSADALALVDLTIATLSDLTPEAVSGLDG